MSRKQRRRLLRAPLGFRLRRRTLRAPTPSRSRATRCPVGLRRWKHLSRRRNHGKNDITTRTDAIKGDIGAERETKVGIEIGTTAAIVDMGEIAAGVANGSRTARARERGIVIPGGEVPARDGKHTVPRGGEMGIVVAAESVASVAITEDGAGAGAGARAGTGNQDTRGAGDMAEAAAGAGSGRRGGMTRGRTDGVFTELRR